MKVHFFGLLLCGGLLAFAALAAAPASAAPTTVTCNPAPAAMKAIVADDETIFTDSQLYRNIAESSVNFVQGGTAPGCVVVRFSAEAGATNGSFAFIEVRPMLDGVTLALPPNVRLGLEDGGEAARSYEFIFPNVAPGNHVVRMQFRSSNGGDVFVTGHTTVVLHAR